MCQRGRDDPGFFESLMCRVTREKPPGPSADPTYT